MISLLRQPDRAIGATEESPFRFEESKTNDVDFRYEVLPREAKVIVYPSGSPVRYLKLRFRGDLSGASLVYGDEWERVGYHSPLQWTCLRGDRPLPWFCYVQEGNALHCYGVKARPNCFPFFQVDPHGITLFLNLCCGNEGTDLQDPLLACEVVELHGETNEDPFLVAKRFSSLLCSDPKKPRSPIYGTNNWYWAYGDISEETVLKEAEQLEELTEGCANPPYLILDDGWQKARENPKTDFIGGPWIPNSRFKDLRRMNEAIKSKGIRPGAWWRPLLTKSPEVPGEAILCQGKDGGVVLDPSHPATLEYLRRQSRILVEEYGFDLLKFDFTLADMTGHALLMANAGHTANLLEEGRSFYDKAKTTAEICKGMYEALAEGAGKAEVIACGSASHLSAGYFSAYRAGDDTSGNDFMWTLRNGVNSWMRLPLHQSFYLLDPDCAPFTPKVPFEENADYLELSARGGLVTLASITPDFLNEEQKKRISEVFHLADQGGEDLAIEHYEANAFPEDFVSERSGTHYHYDWTEAYDGSRVSLKWRD